MAQIVYHISGYLDIVAQKMIYMGQEIDVAIPTGNFGNILSAIYAKVCLARIHNLADIYLQNLDSICCYISHLCYSFCRIWVYQFVNL